MNNSPIILVVDDEIQIRRLLKLCLEAHGYIYHESAAGKEGLIEAARIHPDCIILDLGLPDMDGKNFLRSFREWSDVPVIILTARGAEEEKISLLDAGANDYLTKPFSTGELLARLRVCLRSTLRNPQAQIFESGNLKFDLTTRIVTKNGEEVHLTPMEYFVARFLIINAGKVLTHNQIIKDRWGADTSFDASYLRVFMMQLRRKLEDDPSNPKIFITEPGIGYRVVPPSM
jgi:two-component system KDP operon response regulator KdpE